MEYFLIISIMNIKIIDVLKKIKDRKNTYVYADNYNFFFENTDIYKKFQLENVSNSYVSFLISKKLNLKILKSKKVRKVFLFENLKKKIFEKKILYFFYNLFWFI